MTQEIDLNDFAKALEDMPDDSQHEMVIWRWFMKHSATTRTALTQASKQATNGLRPWEKRAIDKCIGTNTTTIGEKVDDQK
jgi:uncharacterized protein YmfQ (DUF2313 family)